MLSDRAFIFHIYIPWGKTLSLVPKSRSSVKVKVKYQGHSLKEKKLLFGTVQFERYYMYMISLYHLIPYLYYIWIKM